MDPCPLVFPQFRCQRPRKEVVKAVKAISRHGRGNRWAEALQVRRGEAGMATRQTSLMIMTMCLINDCYGCLMIINVFY